MDNEKFIDLCKHIVIDYSNKNIDGDIYSKITKDDVFVVWSCKTLQNNKALLSTKLKDSMYYEITHNGDKHEIYVDAYKKVENYIVYKNNKLN